MIYFALAITIFMQFDHPFTPYRGEVSLNLDSRVVIISSLLQIVLIFFVVDASQQCVSFINNLREAGSQWSNGVCDKFHRDTRVAYKYLDEHIDVTLIAKGTEAVGRLIFYPFVILLLMIISRSNFLGCWNWPPSLIIILGLNAAYAVYAVFELRCAAEKAREEALEKLNNKLLNVLGQDNSRGAARQIRLLIQKIKSCEEGVFAPVSRQPVIKALLMPFGGAGILTLLDYVATKM